MRIVGIDASLTATGIAVIDNDPNVELVTVTTLGSKSAGPTVDARFCRIHELAEQIAAVAGVCDYAYIEAPSLGSNGRQNHTWDRAGLWWKIIGAMTCETSEVAPARLKKFASGKGNADKTAVAAGMVRLWGDRVEPANDNEFDALALATLGAAVRGLNLPIRLLERHHEVAKIVGGAA